MHYVSRGGIDIQVISLLSGKGGTGKTTLTVGLARALAEKGFKVGVLDADSTGANAHKLLPMEKPYSTMDVTGEPPTIQPAVAKFPGAGPILFVGLSLVSESYVNWAGESHGEFVKQMIERTNWGDIEYLLLDCPPGTHSDAKQAIQCSNTVVLVTTPSSLARLDAERTLDLVAKMRRPVAGLYINFDMVVCPGCGHRFRLFGDEIPDSSELVKLPLIQRIPWVQSGHLDIDTDKFIRCIGAPLTLKPRQTSVLKRGMMKLLFRKLGRDAIKAREKGEKTGKTGKTEAKK